MDSHILDSNVLSAALKAREYAESRVFVKNGTQVKFEPLSPDLDFSLQYSSHLALPWICKNKLSNIRAIEVVGSFIKPGTNFLLYAHSPRDQIQYNIPSIRFTLHGGRAIYGYDLVNTKSCNPNELEVKANLERLLWKYGIRPIGLE